MMKHLKIISGIVVEGHRVASKPSKDYPYGTLGRQFPLFKARGLNLEEFHQGTLNLSIAPVRFELIKPAFTFRQVEWTNLHPPEDFSFSPILVKHKGKEFKGFIYYPHPETKIRHFENDTIIELITEKIPGMIYGTCLELVVDSREIRIHKK